MEKLDINPDEAKNDKDLADWICEEMRLKKAEPSTRGRSSTSDSDDTAERLRKMRDTRRD